MFIFQSEYRLPPIPLIKRVLQNVYIPVSIQPPATSIDKKGYPKMFMFMSTYRLPPLPLIKRVSQNVYIPASILTPPITIGKMVSQNIYIPLNIQSHATTIGTDHTKVFIFQLAYTLPLLPLIKRVSENVLFSSQHTVSRHYH